MLDCEKSLPSRELAYQMQASPDHHSGREDAAGSQHDYCSDLVQPLLRINLVCTRPRWLNKCASFVDLLIILQRNSLGLRRLELFNRLYFFRLDSYLFSSAFSCDISIRSLPHCSELLKGAPDSLYCFFLVLGMTERGESINITDDLLRD
jgi:hypothetical protein